MSGAASFGDRRRSCSYSVSRRWLLEREREKEAAHLISDGRRKKMFRVTCSHLGPGSVVHLYAGDWKDFRTLVASQNAHVYSCVDAQMGPGVTGGIGTHVIRVGIAATITHRPETKIARVLQHSERDCTSVFRNVRV